MHQFLQTLFEQQRAVGFADFAGSDVAATIAIADRWLMEQIAGALQPEGLVRQLRIEARPDNQLAVSMRVAKGGITLPIQLVLAIDAQPELPEKPILRLRFKEAPLFVTLGGPLVKLLKVLPPGIAMDGEGIDVDIAALFDAHEMTAALRYITELRLSTADATLVVMFRARLPPPNERTLKT